MMKKKTIIDMFVGTSGERINVNGRIIKRIHREKWGEKAKSLYVVLTNDRRRLTFGSTGKFTVGAEYSITGIVKQHQSFCNNNQTHISDWIITRDFKRNKDEPIQCR